MNTTTMEVAIRNLISALAGKYEFNAKEAFEFIQWETDVNHVVEILKMVSTEMPTQTVTENKGGAVGGAEKAPQDTSEIDEKIATCKKNIETWEKKLASGKAKDADKQTEKIEKEKAKLAKLEKKAGVVEKKKVDTAEKKVETETKKTDVKEVGKKVEETEKKDDKKEKRIKRFSPVMSSQLKKFVEDAGLEMNDKMKKDFQQYVEDLTDSKYRESGLADHMRDFVKTKKKVETKTDVKEVEKKVDTTEKKEEVPKYGPITAQSNAVGGGPEPDVQNLTLEELQAIGTIASVDPVGTYWDADGGRFVSGPVKDDDEDFVEIKFEKKDYVVGEKTGRVYEARDSGDVFAGFVGVGKFKGMKMP